MSIDPSIPAFTGTVIRLTDTPLVAAGMFAPAALAGLGPDAHIDEPNRRIVMYFHGLLRDGDQQTRLATSTDGLHFTPQAPLLGPPYFRALQLDGVIYLSIWEGRLGRMIS